LPFVIEFLSWAAVLGLAPAVGFVGFTAGVGLATGFLVALALVAVYGRRGVVILSRGDNLRGDSFALETGIRVTF
jgi:hypothetical protein